jgi:hypothetical protein
MPKNNERKLRQIREEYLMELKEILGEDLFAQVSEKLKGAGDNGKDIEIVPTNTGDYVPASKYETLKGNYNKVKTDYDTLNSKFDADISAAKADSEKLLKKTLVEQKLATANVAKINGGYDIYFTGSVLDIDKITVSDGKVTGVEDLVNGFITANPNLVSKPAATEVKKEAPKSDDVVVPQTTGINPANAQGQVKDLAYYKSAYAAAGGLEEKIQIKDDAARNGIMI